MGTWKVDSLGCPRICPGSGSEGPTPAACESAPFLPPSENLYFCCLSMRPVQQSEDLAAKPCANCRVAPSSELTFSVAGEHVTGGWVICLLGCEAARQPVARFPSPRPSRLFHVLSPFRRF